MKLNFAFLGLGLAGGVDVHTKSYDPKVHCDVLKNEFRVELPAFKCKLHQPLVFRYDI